MWVLFALLGFIAVVLALVIEQVYFPLIMTGIVLLTVGAAGIFDCWIAGPPTRRAGRVALEAGPDEFGSTPPPSPTPPPTSPSPSPPSSRSASPSPPPSPPPTL